MKYHYIAITIFSDVKISCLHNKSIFFNSCSFDITLQHILHQSIKLSYTKRWISVSSGHFRLFRISLISLTMEDVNLWWRSKDDFTSWVISLGKTEESAKLDARVKALATFPTMKCEVKVLFKEFNCPWSSAQAVRSFSIATCTSASLSVPSSSALRYDLPAPIMAPIPAPAATIKLVPKVKGAAKTEPTTPPIMVLVIMPAGFSGERFLAKCSSVSLVCLLIGIQGRKASCNSLRSLSNVWLAVAKERKSKYVNLQSFIWKESKWLTVFM